MEKLFNRKLQTTKWFGQTLIFWSIITFVIKNNVCCSNCGCVFLWHTLNYNFTNLQVPVAPSRASSRMQQYEDAAADDAEDDPVDGANGIAEDGDHHPPPAENSSTPAAANDGQQQNKHQTTESDDEDYEDPRQPPRTNGGAGFWRQGLASRPQSPTMADNVSDASSMAPPARPKSRVDLATSRYGRCCKDRMGMGDFNERCCCNNIKLLFKQYVLFIFWICKKKDRYKRVPSAL